MYVYRDGNNIEENPLEKYLLLIDPDKKSINHPIKIATIGLPAAIDLGLAWLDVRIMSY